MKGLFDLSGKKAVLVGAGDLGSSMLESLLEYGASAVVIGRGEGPSDLVIEQRNRGFEVSHVHADISDTVQINESFKAALEILEGIDILINIAGIQRRHKSEDFPLDDWNDVINVNLTATFTFCQLAAQEMLKQGQGKIINIASMLSFFGGFTVPAYAASKGGVMQLTKALANEWACSGINVNAIAPGYMNTKMNTALVNDPIRNSQILARIPQKRWGCGEDLKGVTVFLASAASDYVNGAIIPVDGGYLGC